MFKIQYELHPSPIPSIFWTTYVLLAQQEYNNLLENYPNDEKVFQEFFERNPSFMPGAFELRELSGHLPHLQCLISQPEIGTTYTRKPDFLWLSQDSLTIELTHFIRSMALLKAAKRSSSEMIFLK